MIVGHNRFTEQRLDDWRAELIRYLDHFISRAERALPDENDRLFGLVENDSFVIVFSCLFLSYKIFK